MTNKTPVLITLMLGTFMAALDSSIVNVSLPSIQKQFDVNIGSIQWVIAAYMMAFCLFIPLTNWLQRRLGYYRLLMSCITVFTIGSLVCSLSTNIETLVIARIFQAIGGGGLSPVSLAIINDHFPKHEKGSAISWWGIGNVIGPALGPTLGGLLTQYLGWPSIFYVNIPVGILALFMGARHLSFLKKEPVSKPRFDLSSYIFFALFIVLLQNAIATAGKPGYGWIAAATLAASAVCLLFFIRSSKKNNPLIELSVFTIRAFNYCASVIFIRSVALFGGLFFLPFLLQNRMGFSELQTGLLILPNTIVTLIFRPMAGKLADRGIIRRPSVVGIFCLALSMFQFGVLDAGSSILWVLLGMAARGFGMAMLVSPVSTALLNAVRSNQSTTAASVNSLLMQVGGSTGIALSALLHSFVQRYYEGLGQTAQQAEHMGLMYGFIISGCFVLLALLPAMKLPDHNQRELPHEPLSVSVGTN